MPKALAVGSVRSMTRSTGCPESHEPVVSDCPAHVLGGLVADGGGGGHGQLGSRSAETPLTGERDPLVGDVRPVAPHQAQQPEGYPYVFVPPERFDRIQEARRAGKWTIRQGKCPIANFRRQWQIILARAGVEQGTFHDLRRTCITNWFAHGLSEYEVMIMAGHASFDTTRKFYMAVRNDLLAKARRASSEAMKLISGTHLARTPLETPKTKKAAEHKCLTAKDLSK